jgi:hypothetical protein
MLQCCMEHIYIYITIVMTWRCKEERNVPTKYVFLYKNNFFWHSYVLGLLYRMTLCTEPSDRDVRTRSAVSRNVDLGTRYVTVCVVSLVAGRSGGKRYNYKKSKRIPSIFNDESTESFICLRQHIYISHVNKVQLIRVKIICVAVIRVTYICVA